jgi:Tfp pilus assembly protein PilV
VNAAPRVTAVRTAAQDGSALVEALVALVLIAIGGLVVATAAANGLRASGRAATLGRTTAYAARELATVASRAATATDASTSRSVSGFAAPVACATDVERDGALVTLAVAVDVGVPAEHVALTTRRLLDVEP